MIPSGDLVRILVTAVGVALLTGVVTLFALHLLRRSAAVVRLLVLATGLAVSTAAATLAIGAQMYLSGHDLVVLCWVLGASSLSGLAVAAVLGTRTARATDRFRRDLRAVAEGQVVTAEYETGEFSRLSGELAETSRKLEAARTEVAALDASRRRLVAWISHDLRTPLAALQAMAESLEDGVAQDPARYHRQIRGQAEVLTGMVDDLFELSKIQSGTLRLRPETMSLYDLLSDSVADLHPVAVARGITLRESRTGDLTVRGDPRELSRVLNNLLVNAIQHTEEGGEILISACEAPEDHVVLSVTDSGGGIPEEDLALIFDAGWRGTPARTPTGPTSELTGWTNGAGLGLAIVKGIVTAHAGRVSVANVPGGCRFDVLLPRWSDGRTV
ncbi:HAMP domain-containing histidine kinase [Kineococcus sp. NBC_00420]|uniref:sensor histidine kinase n=1 Tax=Kineococcus sp. NBC_00420 TaxID=2903564 RepID=UPI002E2253CB